jgi:outer membrane receptor protein involved in Fe transport
LLRRAFVKIGHQTEDSDIDVSVTLANNQLEGSQALPVSFLGDIRQPYTWPDINRNELAMLAAKGSRFLAEGVLLGATAYWRRFDNENFSSNVNGEDDGPPGTNDLATLSQRGFGAGLQLTVARPLAGRENVFIAGASLDAADARYTRLEQPSAFSPARESVGTGPFELETSVRTDSRRSSAFASDTYTFARDWALTLSGRYDRSEVDIGDLSGTSPAVEGRHRFGRFNPAAGLTRQLPGGVTTYAAYSESMRAPTAMELTCADPQAPCKLPNAFLSDPPLRPVVARTVEAGVRGGTGTAWRWSAALFRTAVDDDIQFVSSDAAAATAGYFRNVGATRRQGAELALEREWERVAVMLRYSHVDATFRSPFRETSPNNATADASGTIAVEPGHRIPGVPRDALRLAVEVKPHPAWSVQGTLAAAGRQWARGDENNADPSGAVPGYAVAGAHVRWRLSPRLEMSLLVDNLFNARYARSGVLGRNFFANEGHTYDTASARAEAFRGPGAPLGAWLSLRWRWD